MTSSGIFLRRFSKRALISSLLIGITLELILCKTVTDPNLEYGQEMKQDQEENQEDASARNEHSLDPDALLHHSRGDHGKQPVEKQTPVDLSHGANEPNVQKHVLGRVADQDSSRVAEDLGSPGPDQESMLHGGQKHVHESSAPDNLPKIETGAFGVDPEELMHDGKDVHSHESLASGKLSETVNEPIGINPEEMMHDGKDVHAHHDTSTDDEVKDEEMNDYGIDMDAMLHDGQPHVHSAARKSSAEDEIPEVPVGATDPEAFLHQGEGQVHSHARTRDVNDEVPRPYDAADPETMLHGEGGNVHDHAIRQQAMEGSRPLTGPKDPDDIGTHVNLPDVGIGTLRPEDAKDYHQWKTEKKQKTDKDSMSGWLSGFSYITDAIFRDLQAAKQRYLAKLWSGDEATKSSDSDDEIDDAAARAHDEA